MYFSPSTLIITMQIVSAVKSIVPQFHAFNDDDNRYHIGATWVSDDGLKDYHNVEIRYTRNSESLALKGEPQPDGSWKYIEPSGAEHVMTAERVNAYMKQTHKPAVIMNEMLTKLEAAGLMQDAIETVSAPA
jgi:hypothetical protein